jgi:hypothetical protein
VDSRAGLDAVAKIRNPCSCRESNSGLSTRSLVTTRNKVSLLLNERAIKGMQGSRPQDWIELRGEHHAPATLHVEEEPYVPI